MLNQNFVVPKISKTYNHKFDWCRLKTRHPREKVAIHLKFKTITVITQFFTMNWHKLQNTLDNINMIPDGSFVLLTPKTISNKIYDFDGKVDKNDFVPMKVISKSVKMVRLSAKISKYNTKKKEVAFKVGISAISHIRNDQANWPPIDEEVRRIYDICNQQTSTSGKNPIIPTESASIQKKSAIESEIIQKEQNLCNIPNGLTTGVTLIIPKVVPKESEISQKGQNLCNIPNKLALEANHIIPKESERTQKKSATGKNIHSIPNGLTTGVTLTIPKESESTEIGPTVGQNICNSKESESLHEEPTYIEKDYVYRNDSAKNISSTQRLPKYPGRKRKVHEMFLSGFTRKDNEIWFDVTKSCPVTTRFDTILQQYIFENKYTITFNRSSTLNQNICVFYFKKALIYENRVFDCIHVNSDDNSIVLISKVLF